MSTMHAANNVPGHDVGVLAFSYGKNSKQADFLEDARCDLFFIGTGDQVPIPAKLLAHSISFALG